MLEEQLSRDRDTLNRLGVFNGYSSVGRCRNCARDLTREVVLGRIE